MLQNILYGYSETLAGDTPDPGKCSKISAIGDFALCEHAFGMAFPGTAWVNFFTNTFLSDPVPYSTLSTKNRRSSPY